MQGGEARGDAIGLAVLPGLGRGEVEGAFLVGRLQVPAFRRLFFSARSPPQPHTALSSSLPEISAPLPPCKDPPAQLSRLPCCTPVLAGRATQPRPWSTRGMGHRIPRPQTSGQPSNSVPALPMTRPHFPCFQNNRKRAQSQASRLLPLPSSLDAAIPRLRRGMIEMNCCLSTVF